MDTKELFTEIDKEFSEFRLAHDKSASGNKSAATRARKSSSVLTKLMKEYRSISVSEGK